MRQLVVGHLPKSGDSKVTGAEAYQQRLAELAEEARRAYGFQISIEELMPSEFISECSSFASIDDLFAASPFKLDSWADFNAIPDTEWDAFISSQTSYNDWEEMQKAAWVAWTCRQHGSTIH